MSATDRRRPVLASSGSAEQVLDLLEPVGDRPRRQVEAARGSRHVLAGIEVRLERLDELVAEPLVGEQRAELTVGRSRRRGPGRPAAAARGRAAPDPAIQPRRPSRWAIARGVDEIGVGAARSPTPSIGRRADGDPRGLGVISRWPSFRARLLDVPPREPPRTVSSAVGTACSPAQSSRRQDGDPPHERQHGRQPDPGADPLGARRRSTRAGGRSVRRAPRARRRRCPAVPAIGSLSGRGAIAISRYGPVRVQAVSDRDPSSVRLAQRVARRTRRGAPGARRGVPRRLGRGCRARRPGSRR